MRGRRNLSFKQRYSLNSSIILKYRQQGFCWLGVFNLLIPLSGNIYILLRSWKGEETDTEEQVKFMSFPIICVVSDSERHIYSYNPNNFVLWWVIPGIYVLKIVTSTSMCNKSSFFILACLRICEFCWINLVPRAWILKAHSWAGAFCDKHCWWHKLFYKAGLPWNSWAANCGEYAAAQTCFMFSPKHWAGLWLGRSSREAGLEAQTWATNIA